MDEPIDIAVIGAGAIGRTHVETVATVASLRLCAVVDPSPGAEALAGSAGVRWFHGVDEMIGSGLARAAIVATPNETHLPISEALLRAGLPVLLEKPVAESLTSAIRLIALADETGVPVLVGHHRRHNPIVRSARDAIRSGLIGDLVMAGVVCALAKPPEYFSAAWRRSPGAGGPLLINLVHEVDLLRHFFGEIAGVQALASNARRGFDVEDTAAVCLSFENGGLASLCISDTATGPWAWDLTAGENPKRFPVHPVSAHHYAGSRGALSLPDLTVWETEGEPDWTRRLLPRQLPVIAADPYAAQLDHFADLVHGRITEPAVSLRDAAANLIVLDAIRRSAATGSTASVDLAPLLRPSDPASELGGVGEQRP